MSLQSLEGFVLNVMDSTSCFHFVSSLCEFFVCFVIVFYL